MAICCCTVENVCARLAVNSDDYTLFKGYAHLAAGLSCGLGSLAAGMAIGIVGDAGVRCVGLTEKPLEGRHKLVHTVINHMNI